MKRIYIALFLLITLSGFAQAPAGYYDSATGTGYALKTQLYNIIKNGTTLDYGELYNTYQTSDLDAFYENDGTILDMYSENPSGVDPYNYSSGPGQRCGTIGNEGSCYNREHIIPQSVFNELPPMVSDAHFVTPTDGKVNGIRSNFPHGNVTTASATTLNGSKLGTSGVSGYSGTVFEPIDEFKGDIARMYLYFATRYENVIDTWKKPYPMFDGSVNKVFTTSFLSLLLAWNALDPVNAREISRNNAIYARQGNRNPFIDRPEFVNMIWNTIPDTENPTAATNLMVTGTTSSTITLSWTAATDNTGIASYDLYVDGVLKDNSTGITKTISGLAPLTTYSFYIIAKDFDGNKSIASNTINGTTTAVTIGGTASDLFFSEYVEGSGSNKALEIANFTGTSVDLSIYSLKKQTNGAGTWLSANPLSGTLSNGAVYVAVDATILNTCYALASANISYPGSTASSPTAFNGNDPIGLFKKDVLIDIIGTFNGGNANFAQDQTLRRKPIITAPNVVFNKALEWDQFAIDKCENLGIHFINTLSTVNFTSQDFTIRPNPSDGHFNIDFEANEKYIFEIYSSIGQKVFEASALKNNTLSITNLPKGIYFVKVFKDVKSIVKKIVIN
jgi:endonuclease I